MAGGLLVLVEWLEFARTEVVLAGKTAGTCFNNLPTSKGFRWLVGRHKLPLNLACDVENEC